MYKAILPISFHKDRTIPLSDVCKNMLGTLKDKHMYTLESLQLKSNQDTQVLLDYEIHYDVELIQTSSVDVSSSFNTLDLTPKSKQVGLGLYSYTILFFSAQEPRKTIEEPYDLQLLITLCRKN
jgi:hypothetical protein